MVSFPVYLEPGVDDDGGSFADEKITVQDLVNEWLRANIRLEEEAKATQMVGWLSFRDC